MGKAALIMVLGLSIVLLLVGPSLKSEANRAYENFLSYNTETQVHNITVSAANMAASQLFFDNTWHTGYSNVSFGGGTYDVTVQDLASSRKKLTAIGHLNNVMKSGTVQNVNDTVEVLLQPSSFSKFAVYLNTMSGVQWATGDTVWGPCHIEGTMNISGTPAFYGKVTTKSGTNPAKLPTATVKPKFYGGYQSGVSIPLPTNLSQLQTAATTGGKVFSPPASPAGTYEVRMTFNSDGTVSYQEYKGATKLSDVTIPVSSLAPNGAILVSNGNIRVKGTVKGQATIGAMGASGNGNVYINGDIRYATDPAADATSTDLLGIVADNNVQIPLPPGFPTPPAPSNVMIQAAIFSRTGNFSAQLNSGMGKLGSVTVYGSLTTYGVGAFSVGDASGNILYGYKNNFQFDNRLLVSAPPYYPTTGLYEVLSWKE